MGEVGQSRRDSVPGRGLKAAARVVPDVASFSVDDGFWYSIPEHLISEVSVGSIVRVPLGARRVRGWVTELAEREGQLKDIAGVSGAIPVVDDRLLETLVWMSRHYLSPLAPLLRRASPPNLPRERHSSTPGQFEPADSDHPMFELAARAASGRRSPIVALITSSRDRSWVEALAPVLASGQSVLIVTATAAEAQALGEMVTASVGPERVAVAAGESDAEDTRAWERAQYGPCVLVGTPRVAVWRVAGLAMAIVVEEGRRAMKDRQTPTVHVREVMVTRSRLERFNLVFVGPTPSLETLALGAEVVAVPGRPWALVEVVDMSQQRQGGGGWLDDRTISAMRSMVSASRSTFVFTHRRADQASVRCESCHRPRRCESCRKRIGMVKDCPHCGTVTSNCPHCGGDQFELLGTIPAQLADTINRRLGGRVAGVYPAAHPIQVGTERDLADLGVVDLAVVADVDGVASQPGHRGSEEALRQLARVAGAVRRGSGSRLILQTHAPDSDLVRALTRGDPIPYLEGVLVERARLGVPPASEMTIVEVRGDIPQGAESEMDDLEDIDVLGPLPVEDGMRWLLTGKLQTIKPSLRSVIGRWRDGGATVRVDVDPIDL